MAPGKFIAFAQRGTLFLRARKRNRGMRLCWRIRDIETHDYRPNFARCSLFLFLTDNVSIWNTDHESTGNVHVEFETRQKETEKNNNNFFKKWFKLRPITFHNGELQQATVRNGASAYNIFVQKIRNAKQKKVRTTFKRLMGAKMFSTWLPIHKYFFLGISPKIEHYILTVWHTTEHHAHRMSPIMTL